MWRDTIDKWLLIVYWTGLVYQFLNFNARCANGCFHVCEMSKLRPFPKKKGTVGMEIMGKAPSIPSCNHWFSLDIPIISPSLLVKSQFVLAKSHCLLVKSVKSHFWLVTICPGQIALRAGEIAPSQGRLALQLYFIDRQQRQLPQAAVEELLRNGARWSGAAVVILYWLVVWTPPLWKRLEFVNWDDD